MCVVKYIHIKSIGQVMYLSSDLSTAHPLSGLHN